MKKRTTLFAAIALVGLVAAQPARAQATRGAYAPDGMRVVLGVKVHVSGELDMAWENLTGGGLVTEVAEANLGTDQYRETTAGYKHVGDLTLSGPLTTGRSLLAQWLNDTMQGRTWQRDVGLTELLTDGSDGTAYCYQEAFPVGYVFPELSASGTGNLMESVVVKANRMELGVSCGGTRGVNESTHEVLENGAGKFSVDIQNAPQASANVESVSIEDLIIDAREMTTGSDWDYRVYGPGDFHLGTVTVKSRAGRDNELYQWWLDNSQGKNITRYVTVRVLSRDGSLAREYQFLGCFPLSWDPGEYGPESNVAVETVVMRCTQVEFG